MEAANMHKKAPGELVLQNGRQAGARRPLGAPTTFIGRSQDCDVRLNVEGVDPMHCLLVVADAGVQMRDLNSVHGTFVNGVRADNVALADGDLLKVGPFQFRLELTARPTVAPDDAPVEEYREVLRIQAAAVAAQQIALEEEEARLLHRRHDLQQQEEQLAAHLDEKQRQVQLWSDYTKAERDTLRKEKLDQEKRLDKLEQELYQAKQEVGRDHQKLTQERQHIHKVYQRLRQRWQRQWTAEKERHQKLAKKLHADACSLDEREHALVAKEASLMQVILRHNAERELGTRQLQDARATLTKDQASWRRRRSHEFLVLKGMQRQADETQLRLEQARQLLVEEKGAWDKQLDSLQKELHGLNNRIIHQCGRVQEQSEELAGLEAQLRDRQLQVKQLPPLATEVIPDDSAATAPLCDVIVVSENAEPAPGEPAVAENWQRRFAGLDQLANELADQRVHLLEQYQRLAEIQDAWQHQRAQTSAELETLAQRLVEREQDIAQRAHQTSVVEQTLYSRQQEIETLRAEIHAWRTQLETRAQALEQEHRRQTDEVGQTKALLEEQIAGLAKLRLRWNQRRQHELEQLRANHTVLDEQQTKTLEQRQGLFEKGQQLDEEKRILAEKALALEQYRQEVFFRAKDPAAQRRVERLRRRWLALNAGLIRNAKAEREAAKKELQHLETRRTELNKTTMQATQHEASLTEKQVTLEEREGTLKVRQALVEQTIGKLEGEREQTQTQHLRLQDEIDTLAKAVYDDMDQAA